MIERDWYNLYSDGWQGEIVSEAFAHPAKFARGLIRCIYEHALEMEWIKPGDIILDPFGGVALGGLDAMRHGLHWIGVELESKFVELGQQNIELWQRKYADRVEMWGLDSWGTAVILQGDSRELGKVLVDGIVSSPPYAKSLSTERHGIDWSKTKKDYPGRVMHSERTGMLDRHHNERQYRSGSANLGNLPATDAQFNAAIGSPPYAGQTVHGGGGIDADKIKRAGGRNSQASAMDDYGDTDGQLGAMPEGSHADAIISSPPYAESLASDDPDKRGGLFRDPKRRKDKTLTAQYGVSEGRLGAMSVSSPGYGGSEISDNRKTINKTIKGGDGRGGSMESLIGAYATDGNICSSEGGDFWSAARQIMEQLAIVLPSGAHAIWVLKAFVRDKKIVDFPDQWRQLGEACGFETVEWIRAWLVEDRGTQYGLWGEIENQSIERKSFFRRLSEAKAQAAEFWSQVSHSDKRRFLRNAYKALWRDYDNGESLSPPTRLRVEGTAHMDAWKKAGKPAMDIETRIDHEIVLIQKRL